MYVCLKKRKRNEKMTTTTTSQTIRPQSNWATLDDLHFVYKPLIEFLWNTSINIPNFNYLWVNILVDKYLISNLPKTLAPRLFSIFAEKFRIDSADSLPVFYLTHWFWYWNFWLMFSIVFLANSICLKTNLCVCLCVDRFFVLFSQKLIRRIHVLSQFVCRRAWRDSTTFQ